jgi:hypothetical protein
MFSASIPWCVEMNDKKEQKDIEEAIAADGGALVKVGK